MALRDPVDFYRPDTNLDAHLICAILVEAGIPAIVTEDTSLAGLWVGGTSPIHKPQIMIERNDVERARPLIEQYEAKTRERFKANKQTDSDSEEGIAVTCENCQTVTTFPLNKKGTVQSCPKCSEYLDVGDDVGFEGWEDAESVEE